MLSISSWLRLLTPEPMTLSPMALPTALFTIGTPSTTHNGSLLPVIELKLRILTDVLPPGPVCDVFTLTPATLPARASVTLETGTALRSPSLRFAAAYPIVFWLFVIPRAVTTTSSSIFSSVEICMNMPFFAAACFVFIPIYEKTSVSPGFALMVNLPFTSVTVPWVAPFTFTLAPMMGSLSVAETTVPVMAVCAQAVIVTTMHISIIVIFLFIKPFII